MWRKILPLLETTVRTSRVGTTRDLTEVATFLNNTVASRCPRTSISDLATYVDQNPPVNITDHLIEMVFDLDEWKMIREAVDNIASTICVDLDGGDPGQFSGAASLAEMARTQANSSVQRRFINPEIFGPSKDQYQGVGSNLIPGLTTIFAGIAAGKVFPPCPIGKAGSSSGFLQLHYARWDWYIDPRFTPGYMIPIELFAAFS